MLKFKQFLLKENLFLFVELDFQLIENFYVEKTTKNNVDFDLDFFMASFDFSIKLLT